MLVMGNEAVGAYIQTLRDDRRWTRAKMLEVVDTTENTLWRIESGKQEPASSLMFVIIRVLEGSLEDVSDLMLSDADAKEGRRRANAWLDDVGGRRSRAFVESSTPDELAYVLEQLRAEAIQEPTFIKFIKRLVPAAREKTLDGRAPS